MSEAVLWIEQTGCWFDSRAWMICAAWLRVEEFRQPDCARRFGAGYIFVPQPAQSSGWDG
jgi:hypothetical protein